ncbi:MAG: nucleotide sugar dehydrogenase [Bradymonadales bacterium]|nr:MAG: nucleotide sugar dehydrogenase [Bradymonadales bacterium]
MSVELDNVWRTHLVRATCETEAFPSNYGAGERLQEKILQKTAKIGIIGQGYVGLPLAIVFNRFDFSVLGFEKNVEKIKLLNEGVSYIQDVPSRDVEKYRKLGKFEATSDFPRLKDCDVVIICVPTPLAKTQDPDMSFILSAVESIARNFREGQLVILESTTYPGTTREVVLPILEAAQKQTNKQKLRVGRDFFLAFSPERVDPGNKKYSVFNTPKVVGGVTSICADLACLFYAQALKQVVRVSSPETAEMVKLLENTFRAVNIGLVNEVAVMCEKLGIDCWEVIEAAASKPFGYMPFYPGPGLGGHCIPIDPSYLSWKLRGLNYTARFIELAREVNASMPQFCIRKVISALNMDSTAVNGSRVLVLGVSYKKDIDDVRESPAIDVIHELEAMGAKVDYYDPFVAKLNYEGIQKASKNWSDGLGSDYECVVIITDHTEVDYEAILKSAKRIVDTRNALKKFKHEKIVKL